MANVVVVGSQWGDEGKGKIVDWLSEQADIVVRFQGGHNAGHTLVINGETYKLALLPSGVLRPSKLAVIGNGVVFDPQAFVDVLEKLHSKETQMRARMAAQPKAGFVSQNARAFATYPPTEERIQKAQTEISTLLPSRGDYVVDTNEFQEVKAKLAGADRPILRRHRPGDGVPNAPVLHRRPSEPPPELAPYRQGASVAGLNPPAR